MASSTPNARKAAARKRGGKYTAALAAVSPKPATAARGAHPNADVIAAVNYFDRATRPVIGQAPALRRLRLQLSQRILAHRTENGPGVPPNILTLGYRRQGLWEHDICLAFAQAYTLGTTGETAEPHRRDVAGATIYEVGSGVVYDAADRRVRDLPGSYAFTVCHGVDGGRGDVELQLLDGPDFLRVVLAELHALDAPHDFTADTIGERYPVLRSGRDGWCTHRAAIDAAEKTRAAALLRSTLDEPGSPPQITAADLLTAYGFAPADHPAWNPSATTAILIDSICATGDLDQWDPRTTWQDTAADDPVVALGAAADGQLVTISADRTPGHGLSGIIQGRTGSGKTALLRGIIAGLCTRHSPDEINIATAGSRPSDSFHGLDLPHIVAHLDRPSAPLNAVLDFVLEECHRRDSILAGAGETTAANYRRRRVGNPTLEALPDLFVICDEIGTAIANPQFDALLAGFTRRGVHLILAAQRFDRDTLHGFLPYLAFAVSLAAVSPEDSRAVLGGSDAAYRLSGGPGAAIIDRAPGATRPELQRFTAFDIGTPALAPELAKLATTIATAANQEAPTPKQT